MTASAAFAENGRLDALGANQLGRVLYPALFGGGRRQPANWARFVFLNPQAASRWLQLCVAARGAVPDRVGDRSVLGSGQRDGYTRRRSRRELPRTWRRGLRRHARERHRCAARRFRRSARGLAETVLGARGPRSGLHRALDSVAATQGRRSATLA